MLLKTFSQDQKPLRIITKPKSITQAQITEVIGKLTQNVGKDKRSGTVAFFSV